MTPTRYAVGALVLLATLGGCERPETDGPPTVYLGDSVCAQCNMIISDERWATSTVVAAPRGPDPRLFDDFNCQVAYEAEHPELDILERWSHSHATRQWIRTEEASFLVSPKLRTPMGSKAAAFAAAPEAETARRELDGDVMDFEALWARLGPSDPAPKVPDDPLPPAPQGG